VWFLSGRAETAGGLPPLGNTGGAWGNQAAKAAFGPKNAHDSFSLMLRRSLGYGDSHLFGKFPQARIILLSGDRPAFQKTIQGFLLLLEEPIPLLFERHFWPFLVFCFCCHGDTSS
jgi:hypothetical protein